MAWILVYVILSDFRYDKDPAKNLSELTETEIAKATVPMIPAQTDNTTDYEKSGKLKDPDPEAKNDEFGWTRKKAEEENDEYGWRRKKAEEENDEYDWTRRKAEEEKDDNGAELELEKRKQKKYWKKNF